MNERLLKLRALALTAKAAIYNEDAMTAIELAGVTACKVNECVDAINGMLDLLESSPAITGLLYDANGEAITM